MYKILFWTLLLFVLIGGVAAGAYWYGQQQTLKLLNAQLPKTMPTGSMMEKKDEVGTAGSSMGKEVMQAEDADIVPQGANTVSFARKGAQVLLKYRGKIYDESNQGLMEPAKGVNEAEYKWYGLVDAPATVSAGEFMYDEVFSLKSVSNSQNFMFVMRWGAKSSDPSASSPIDYFVYLYHMEDEHHLHLRKFTEADSKGKNYIPKILSFSKDGDKVALQLYPCWNCGGGAPEIGLLNVETMQFANIGKTSLFEWVDESKYTFKEYKKIECADPGPGECSEKPENLPLKTGTF